MKRRTSTAPVRVYNYGCSHRGVVANLPLVEEQYRRAHTYQQKLTELELKRRTAVREVFAAAPDVTVPAAVVATITTELEQVQVAVSAAKQATRSTRVPVELRALSAELRLQLRAAREVLKLAKKSAAGDKITKEKCAAIEEAHQQAVRDARAACGLYWGSYLIVERAADQQRKELRDPRHRPYTGDGNLAVQLQNGMTVDELLGCEDTRVQLRPTGKGSWKNYICRMRIGTVEGKHAPIWADIEVAVHRPLPSDAKIMWVILHRERKGRTFKYWLQITFEAMSLMQAPIGRRRVAVDLGWRVFASGREGLRVAYWHDSDNKHGELRLPPDLLSALDYPTQLIGVEESWFEKARAQLIEWRTGHVLPPEHVERSSTLGQWKAARRLASYVWWWREHRFAGDKEIFAWMDDWRVRRFWHYRDWSIAQRDKAIARRLDYYRVFAARLLDGCSELLLEDFDLRTFARKREDTPTEIRFWQRTAAPMYLRNALINRAKGQGITVTIVDAAMTTRRCHECSAELPWDQEKLVHTCAACGATWDQDANAAKNILASGSMTNNPLEALAAGETTKEIGEKKAS